MSDRIFANPDQLDSAAKKIKTATEGLTNAGIELKGTDFPHMPGDVRARVQLELSEALDGIRVATADAGTLAVMVARTAMKFRKTAEGDSGVDLGAALIELDKRNLLVDYIADGGLLDGEAADPDFSDWEQFATDLMIGGAIAKLVRPAHWEIVKTKKGIINRGKPVPVKKTGRSTRYLYYGRYARNQFLTKILRQNVPANKLNYKMHRVPAAPISPAAARFGKILGIVGVGLNGYMSYVNAEKKHSYNLTLDDDDVRNRALIDSAGQTGGSVVGGVAAGGVCGFLAAPTIVGAAPAAAACGAAGSWAGGKIGGWVTDKLTPWD